MRAILGLVAAGLLMAGSAHADRVHLVGGAIIEGKATRKGDKVEIELESGLITLAAIEVAKIDSSVSALQRFEELEAQHRARGVEGLMFLADYCRDNDLRARERALLEEVIAQQPNHDEARTRLGFVKSETGWLSRDEHKRAQREADVEAAKQARELAKLELEQRKLELERDKLELELEQQRQKSEAAEAPATELPTSYVIYGGSLGHGHDCAARRCDHPRRKGKPFPIPGVRDPRDSSWPIAGVRDPRAR